MSWLAWALFGNDLDGVDANGPQSIGWRPDLPVGGWKRRVLWWLRNPFHNLFWHVLGLVDPKTQALKADWYRVCLTGGDPRTNWSAHPGWHVCYLTTNQAFTIPRPFVSYWSLRFEFYVGFRERGNFGAALRLMRPL